MAPITAYSASVLRALENELIVRGFIDVWNDRNARGLTPFLHHQIRFRGMGDATARGRHSVLRVCSEIFAAFDPIRIEIVEVQAVDRCVFVEELLQLAQRDTGAQPLALSGFASFTIQADMIVSWRQFHFARPSGAQEAG